MKTLARVLVLLGGCAVAPNPGVGAELGLRHGTTPWVEGPPIRRDPAGTRQPVFRTQYVAPAPGYPPGQYYAPGQGYPGNYAPIPPRYYAPPYYERRYPPPVYVQPRYNSYFCARYPWRCG